MDRMHGWSILLPACLLANALAWPGAPLAQTPKGLPPPADYLGEIRRGPDGKLLVVPESAVWPADVAPRATMYVGPGEKVATPAEAARLARDGEVIEIRPGSYRGQPVVWTQDRLLIRGGERMAVQAEGRGDGRALWIVRGGEVRIENVEFRGARAAGGDGTGLRVESGRVTVVGCRFVDNEIGLATADAPAATLEIADSEFGEAARQGSAPHHLLDVGAIGRLVLRGSRFHDGHLGQLVRSRARESQLFYNLLADGGGKAHHELAFPDGGLAYVVGNVIAQGAGSSDPGIVAYGGEGAPWPENGLYLAHNTLLNERPAGGDFLLLRDERFAAGVEVWAINNLLVGAGNFFAPARGRFEGNRTASRSELIEYAGLPLRLTNLSPLRGGIRPPGSVRGVELMPQAEFSYPRGSRPIQAASALAPGAFQ